MVKQKHLKVPISISSSINALIYFLLSLSDSCSWCGAFFLPPHSLIARKPETKSSPPEERSRVCFFWCRRVLLHQAGCYGPQKSCWTSTYNILCISCEVSSINSAPSLTAAKATRSLSLYIWLRLLRVPYHALNIPQLILYAVSHPDIWVCMKNDWSSAGEEIDVPAHQTVQYFSAAFYSNRAVPPAWCYPKSQKHDWTIWNHANVTSVKAAFDPNKLGIFYVFFQALDFFIDPIS